MSDRMIVFGLGSSVNYAQKVSRHLDVALSEHVQKSFPDGENYLRSNVNVRGADVYVIESLYTDETTRVGEKFFDLLFFIGSLRDASAERITAVTPYLAYSRQDRKTESRAPINTKYVAEVLESVGVDRLLTMDIHNLSSFQNAFRIPTDNLEAKNLFVDYLCGGEEKHIDDPLKRGADDLVVLSPDVGGMGRCRRLRNSIEKRLGVENKIQLAYVDKERKGDKVEGSQIIGNVSGKRVLIHDDMIASGSTIQISCDAVESHGGEVWAVCCTHGFFTGEASKKLEKVKRLIVTDTIEPFRLDRDQWEGRLHVVSTAEMFAKAIRRIHEGSGSISELLK